MGDLNQTTPEVQAVLDRANDQTAIQLIGAVFDNVGTGASGVVLGSAQTSAITSSAGTSGELTTVNAASGEITLGRTGIFKLCLQGSVKSSVASATFLQLIVQLSTDSGSNWVSQGPRVSRDLASTKYGSFAAAFHGSRTSGDMIRILIDSDEDTADFTFSSVSIMTEWMS